MSFGAYILLSALVFIIAMIIDAVLERETPTTAILVILFMPMLFILDLAIFGKDRAVKEYNIVVHDKIPYIKNNGVLEKINTDRNVDESDVMVLYSTEGKLFVSRTYLKLKGENNDAPESK